MGWRMVAAGWDARRAFVLPIFLWPFSSVERYFFSFSNIVNISPPNERYFVAWSSEVAAWWIGRGHRRRGLTVADARTTVTNQGDVPATKMFRRQRYQNLARLK